LSTGDTHLGGDDFDHEIIDWLAEDFKTEEGIDLRLRSNVIATFKEAAEKAKLNVIFLKLKSTYLRNGYSFRTKTLS
jgi:molecular chaperone DnaK (HSP70)